MVFSFARINEAVESYIKTHHNKIQKKKVFAILGKKKNLQKKWQNCLFFEPFQVTKYLAIGKKKLTFPQRKRARKMHVLKTRLKLSFLNSPYNLVVNVKGKDEYFRIKDLLGFSQLGVLNFEYWHLTKYWLSLLFKTNLKEVNLKKCVNGSVLVIQTATFTELLDTLELFNQNLQSVVPVGFFISHRFVWVNTGLILVSDFLTNVLEIQTKINQQPFTLTQRISRSLRYLFSVVSYLGLEVKKFI